MEDGLVHNIDGINVIGFVRLNPCCSGRWSRTSSLFFFAFMQFIVLILVVVEDGLVRAAGEQYETNGQVLILVVVEDGLVPVGRYAIDYDGES